MQNFNNTNSQNTTTNRLCESGNEKLQRTKRKHSHLYNYDQQNMPLMKKFKNSSNNFPNHIQNNYCSPINHEISNNSNEQRQNKNPFTKELNNRNLRIENSIGFKGKILFC